MPLNRFQHFQVSYGNYMVEFSDIQLNRLQELGASKEQLTLSFETAVERNKAFQKLEQEIVQGLKKRLFDFVENKRRPRILELEEKVAALLRSQGFIQVYTPTVLARTRLEKMGITSDTPMFEQVFWLDNKKCLRPMLAPHLYEYMVDLGKLLPRPLRLFEIGTCYRKETHGAKHSNEFTMLNLVEMGLPKDTDFLARLKELGSMVLECAGIENWTMPIENSTVYGDAHDFIDENGLELASSAIGPLEMDSVWKVTENWIGIGFGLERLVMSASKDDNLAKAGRSISYLDGIRLHL